MSELARLKQHVTMCAGKERFEHKARANAVARRMQSHRGEIVHAYKCPDCRGFHLGRPKPDGRQPR